MHGYQMTFKDSYEGFIEFKRFGSFLRFSSFHLFLLDEIGLKRGGGGICQIDWSVWNESGGVPKRFEKIVEEERNFNCIDNKDFSGKATKDESKH